MAVNCRAVNVTSTAGRLDTAAETDSRAGQTTLIYNASDATVYLGPSGVTTSTGLPILTLTFAPLMRLGPDDAVYAITASGTKEVRVFETGV